MGFDPLRERRIPNCRRGDLRAPLGIELSIGVGHQCLVVVDHVEPPSAAASAVRPRARRLVRVPMGTSSNSAASL
jgi:hypothetical protein